MTETGPQFSADTIIEIPFYDVDSAQVVWHGNYSKYFELARSALLDSVDYNYREMEESGYFWPVIDMRIRYINAVRLQQKVRVTATLEEWEHRLRITYLITDLETGARLTKGYTVQVAVRIDSGEMQLASPPVLLQKLGVDP